MKKRYKYCYWSKIGLDIPVSRHFFKLRCIPVENACQQLLGEKLYIQPSVSLRYGKDVFGNSIQYGHTTEIHNTFLFESSGEVEMLPYRLPNNNVSPVFCLESSLTTMNADMEEFFRSLRLKKTTNTKENVLRMAEAVYTLMTYSPGTTCNATTATQAFAAAEGVCQDYVHIFIALCRHYGLPARYANGLMQGVGFTHAWAEVFIQNNWIGIDPTNNNEIEYGYIKIAHGRDAADCPVNRGVFTGAVQQSSAICVSVEELN
jgi:transglutaminase-like putative cysteine protease